MAGPDRSLVVLVPAEAFGGIEAIPTTFIIGRTGTVRYRKVGAMAPEEFAAVLKPFLK